jgi:hypothetical protein
LKKFDFISNNFSGVFGIHRFVSQLSQRKSTMTLFSTISQQFLLRRSNTNHDWREAWILMWHILGRFIFIWELGPTFFRFFQLLEAPRFLLFLLFYSSFLRSNRIESLKPNANGFNKYILKC